MNETAGLAGAVIEKDDFDVWLALRPSPSAAKIRLGESVSLHSSALINPTRRHWGQRLIKRSTDEKLTFSDPVALWVVHFESFSVPERFQPDSVIDRNLFIKQGIRTD
jgi:hypothetical protein